MFDKLSERLSSILGNLTRRGALQPADVDAALKEVRRALLEGDVALEVITSFVERVRARAVGHEVIRSVSPGQQVIKIVHDELVEVLGGQTHETLNLAAVPPVVVMMVGLQGSGKTTTSAKLAKRLIERDKKRVLLASLDTRRPAAMEQLATVGAQVGASTLPIIPDQNPQSIAKRALEAAKLQGYDVLILDTAGRTHIDDALMQEVAQIKDLTNPTETLLVADSLTGQDAVRLAKSFNERLSITGLVLTRLDGDGRGGAALSMRAVTGKPIKFVGTGEKLDALEEFHPSRIAGRILDMGDIVALVEKAAQTIDAQKAEDMANRMRKGTFDLNDMREQLKQMEKIGGMSGLMGMLPGMGKMKDQLAAAGISDNIITKNCAIIDSMTRAERAKPDVLNASRRKRIAFGSGTKVEDVNKLIKMHRQMADVMKAMGSAKGGGLGKMASMFGLGKGGIPGGMPTGLPSNFPGLGSGMPGFGSMPKGIPSTEDLLKSLPQGGKDPLAGLFGKKPK